MDAHQIYSDNLSNLYELLTSSHRKKQSINNILIDPVLLLSQACPDKNYTVSHKKFKGKIHHQNSLLSATQAGG